MAPLWRVGRGGAAIRAVVLVVEGDDDGGGDEDEDEDEYDSDQTLAMDGDIDDACEGCEEGRALREWGLPLCWDCMNLE